MTGAFDWPRRMGVHEAYHQSSANRVVHWVCIPLQLLGVIALLSQVRYGSLDLALVAIGVVGALHVAAEVVAGALMVVDAGLAVALLVGAFVFQTRVGHNVYEHGVDDTAMNVAELRRTRNPIPILLIFFYHLVELLFALGYRPALQREVARHEEAERARLAVAAA